MDIFILHVEPLFEVYEVRLANKIVNPDHDIEIKALANAAAATEENTSRWIQNF